MKNITAIAALALLAACQSPAEIPLIGEAFAPKSAEDALEP